MAVVGGKTMIAVAIFVAGAVVEGAACVFGDGGATALQRREHGAPACGMWGEAVTGVMTLQCRCWRGVAAEREVRRRARSFRQ
jgi:hypothetical protein